MAVGALPKAAFFNDNIILFQSVQVKVNHIDNCFDFSNKKFYLTPLCLLHSFL